LICEVGAIKDFISGKLPLRIGPLKPVFAISFNQGVRLLVFRYGYFSYSDSLIMM